MDQLSSISKLKLKLYIQKLPVFGWCHLRFGPKSTVDLDKIRVEPGDDESTSIV